MIDWAWFSFFGAITVIITWGIWLLFWPREPRILWKCVRYQGGGSLVAPYPMTVREAMRWLARDCNAEIGHIDKRNGFIFYRPRGG